MQKQFKKLLSEVKVVYDMNRINLFKITDILN